MPLPEIECPQLVKKTGYCKYCTALLCSYCIASTVMSNEYRHAKIINSRRTFKQPTTTKKKKTLRRYEEPTDLNQDIFCGASSGDHRIVQKHIKRGAVNQKSPYFPFSTALHCAVVGGRLSIVKLLLSEGADVNATDIMQRTPLHSAAKFGRVSCGMRLLETGQCDISIRDADGHTAYLIATENPDSRDIAESLIFV